jgi:hypothetical protein
VKCGSVALFDTTTLLYLFAGGLKIRLYSRAENCGWKTFRFCRSVHELNDLYSLPNIVRVVRLRRMRWAGHVVRMGEDRGVYRVLVGKPEGNRLLARPRRRWGDNIKMDLQEVGRGSWGLDGVGSG